MQGRDTNKKNFYSRKKRNSYRPKETKAFVAEQTFFGNNLAALQNIIRTLITNSILGIESTTLDFRSKAFMIEHKLNSANRGYHEKIRDYWISSRIISYK